MNTQILVFKSRCFGLFCVQFEFLNLETQKQVFWVILYAVCMNIERYILKSIEVKSKLCSVRVLTPSILWRIFYIHWLSQIYLQQIILTVMHLFFLFLLFVFVLFYSRVTSYCLFILVFASICIILCDVCVYCLVFAFEVSNTDDVSLFLSFCFFSNVEVSTFEFFLKFGYVLPIRHWHTNNYTVLHGWIQRRTAATAGM